jgi:thiamine biosynthesis lipoprotein
MGVPVRIVLYSDDATSAHTAALAAYERIAELDNIMSDYRPQSEVRLLSGRPNEWVPVSEDLFAVLARAREIATLTDGAFDPTVGPFVELWREARRTRRLPDEAALASARRRVGWRLLEVDSSRRSVRLAAESMKDDLGGIANGYILPEAVEVLRTRGNAVAMVEAGGDVVVGEAPPGRGGWAIDVPDADSGFAARARVLRNAAIATSGGTEQFVEIGGWRYSHVVDPRTGLGLTDAITVMVIAGDGATADAVATAGQVMGSGVIPTLRPLVSAIAIVRSAGAGREPRDPR